MKTFFVKLLLFIIPIIILLIPLDSLLSINLRKSKSYVDGEYLVWNDIFNSNVNADIVIYGSSRAWVSFSPIILEDSVSKTAYNLGLDGHNFWLQYLRHKELLKYNPMPKYIILSLDVFSLEKRPDLFKIDQFLPYMLYDNDIYNYTNSYKGFSWIDYNIPLIRFIGKTNAILCAVKCALNLEAPVPIRINGYMGMDREWNDDLAKAKELMQYYDIKIDSASVNLFDQFLSECQTDGIEVILVYSPEYIEGQNFVQDRDKIISMFRNYSEKFKIPFLDYSGHSLSGDKKYFYNSSHLNKVGSEMFTNELVRDLKRMKIFE